MGGLIPSSLASLFPGWAPGTGWLLGENVGLGKATRAAGRRLLLGRRGRGCVVELPFLRRSPASSFCLFPCGGRLLALTYEVPALYENHQKLQLPSHPKRDWSNPWAPRLPPRRAGACAPGSFHLPFLYLTRGVCRGRKPAGGIPEVRPLGLLLLHSELFKRLAFCSPSFPFISQPQGQLEAKAAGSVASAGLVFY